MGVGDLRSSFNAVAAPAFTCTMALLGYSRAHDQEWQILTFRGTDETGAPFEIVSFPLGGDVDVNVAAAETAQRLLDQRKPAP